MVRTKRCSRGLVVLCGMAALTASLISACKIGPSFRTPWAPSAEKWNAADGKVFIGQPADPREWWKAFNDPVLDSLIDRGLQQNLTLQAASLRIVQARAAKVLTAGTLFPIITGGGSASHLNLSENVKPDVDVTVPNVSVNIPRGLDAILDRLPPVLQVTGKPDVNITPKLDLYDAGFDTLWELDLWGGKRRGLEAARAELDAAYAGYDDVRVSLVAEVAATYIEIRTLEARLAALRAVVATEKKFQAIANDKFAKKQTPETDIHIAQAFVGQTESAIPAVEAALARAQNSLSILLGLPPQDVRALVGEPRPIPVASAEVAVGIPADLLRRRPDVRVAEHLAHAQMARIGKAKAHLLPSFSIFGSIGLAASKSNLFFEDESVRGAYGLLGNINGIIFYPLLIEGVRLQDARYEEAVLTYQQAVLRAQAEVENSIVGFLKAKDAEAILQKSNDAANRAAELALDFYDKGQVIVSVPLFAIALQGSFSDRVLLEQGSAATNLVAVYKAMGGGWQNRQGQELVPEEIRARMKDRTEWWTFAGPSDLRTARTEPEAK